MIRKSIKPLIFIAIIFFMASGAYFYYKSFSKIGKEEINEIVKQEEITGPPTTIFRKEYDLETDEGIENASVINETKACSGKRSCELNTDREYGITLIFPLKSIQGGVGLTGVKITSAVWTKDAGEAQWVMEIIDGSNKSISWASVTIQPGSHNWDTLEFSFEIPIEFIHEDYSLKFYPWNKSLKQLWIDNISVNFIGRTSSAAKNMHFSKAVNFYFDLESNEGLQKDALLSETISHSGKRSAALTGKDTYSPSITKVLKDVTDDTLRRISASVWLYCEEENPDAVLAVTITNSEQKDIFWSGKSTEHLQLHSKKWQKLNAVFGIPPEIRQQLKPEDRITIYVWNRSRMKIYSDDFEIVYGEEPERPGLYPFVDMNLKSREAYTFDRNHPPFRINYMRMMNVNNHNGTYLVSEEANKFGNLYPQQEVVILKSEGGKKDLLLHYSGKYFELFRWCEEKNRFHLLGRIGHFPSPIANTKYFPIDVDGDGNSEVLAINESKGWLLKVAFEPSVECANNSEPLLVSTWWTGEVEPNTYQIIADFNKDGNEEWLSSSSISSYWKLNQFKNGSWLTISSGQFPKADFSKPSAIICGYFLPGNSNVQLLIRDGEKEQSSWKAFEYASASKEFRVLHSANLSQLTEIFTNGNRFIKVNIDNDPQEEILLLSEMQKFSLKIVNCDATGFYVHSQIDFKGFPKDCNPKFYETIKLICGNFYSPTKSSLLMVLRNCADLDFDGLSCTTYGGSPDLPDQLQMYTLTFE